MKNKIIQIKKVWLILGIIGIFILGIIIGSYETNYSNKSLEFNKMDSLNQTWESKVWNVSQGKLCFDNALYNCLSIIHLASNTQDAWNMCNEQLIGCQKNFP